jgi:hypothetical protein
MAVFVNAACRTAEGTFKSEAVYQIELPPHDYSGCRLSGLLNHKIAILKTEVFSVLAEDIWEEALF